jgi:hypothetical protein
MVVSLLLNAKNKQAMAISMVDFLSIIIINNSSLTEAQLPKTTALLYIYSPRLRYACHPALRKHKEGILSLFFLYPLYAKGEERVVQRSADRVSQLCNMLANSSVHAYIPHVLRERGRSY